MKLTVFAALVAMLCGIASLAYGAEEERIPQLIEQLGHPEFQKREAASRELTAIGKPAVPFLEKAANHEDPEVRERVAEIQQAIEPPPPVKEPSVGTARPVRRPIGFQRARRAQDAFTADGKNYRVTRETNGGVSSMKVEVTETKDGKTETWVIEAKDDADLARKDADLAALVQRHAPAVQAGAARVMPAGANRQVQVFAQARAIVQVVGDNPEADVTGDLSDGFGVKLVRRAPGIVVEQVVDDSPAGKLGLKVGDLLQAINDNEAGTLDETTAVLKKAAEEKGFTLKVERGGKSLLLKMD